ncbi:MAG TPA: hypothetical protein VMV37_10480 [Gammaproteobacteria bacterium]|nr:hypothetical protein [Gammaproteobacteria bacterium]
MDAGGNITFYLGLALVIIAGIFLGALLFVQAARRGNRRFKWGRSPRPPAGR